MTRARYPISPAAILDDLRFVLVLVLGLVACGGTPPEGRSPVGGTTTCADRPTAPITVPSSTLVVHAEVPLGGLREKLEAKIPRRVVDEKNQDIGMAGRLEVTVDRGAFVVRIEGDALVVETPLKGHAQACAKGSCYASCDPEARAVAKVPPRLGADYKLRTSEVHIDVTRGCQVRVLGGFVTVDVTPTLRARLVQEAKRVQASIDRELPDLSPQATRLWAELNEPRPLPLGACMVLQPEDIVQGPASATVEMAKLRFGLHAKPEVRMRCGDPPPVRSLPPLHDDPHLPPAADVHLATVRPAELCTAPVAADQLTALLPEVAKSLSDDRTTISATVDSAKIEGAGLRADDVVTLVLLRASLTVRTK